MSPGLKATDAHGTGSLTYQWFLCPSSKGSVPPGDVGEEDSFQPAFSKDPLGVNAEGGGAGRRHQQNWPLSQESPRRGDTKPHH